jgi:hypothetical protein
MQFLLSKGVGTISTLTSRSAYLKITVDYTLPLGGDVRLVR